MTKPIPTRFTDDEILLLDELVAEGIGANRSAVIRRALLQLAETVRRARTGAEMADSYRVLPQSTEDDDIAMASAVALTEAESW